MFLAAITTTSYNLNPASVKLNLNKRKFLQSKISNFKKLKSSQNLEEGDTDSSSGVDDISNFSLHNSDSSVGSLSFSEEEN